MGALVDIREGEKKTAFGAFFTLFLVTAGHTMLETGRDALFLARLPVSRLPWVYMAIAAIGFVLSRVGRRKKTASATAVPMALGASALVTSGFWAASFAQSTWFLYALYLWSGLFASWVVLQFWLLLGSTYAVAQAKRLFGFIGAGSILGAVAGSAGARALAGILHAEHLLLGAAALFALAAAPSFLVRPPESAEADAHGEDGAAEDAGDLRLVTGDPFIRRILGLVLLSTLTFTLVDYLFKRAVTLEVPKERLGAFFATVSVILNSAALVLQVVGVGWLLRTLGVHRAVWVMPLLLGGGAAGAFVVGGLYPALVLKGTDGTLRHSLSRTTTELLYVPIAEGKRARAKSFIDLLGQRGGQALASVVILAMVALGSGEKSFAIAIIALCGGWLFVAAGIRRPYLDLFRKTLRQGRIDMQGELPVLDREALEALFAGLSSTKVPEVLAALDLLAAYDRERLVPPLILYHPSSQVVLRALELLAKQRRNDFVPIADWLNGHADVEVRAAALRARTRVEASETILRERLADGCPEVRATALVGLVSREGLMDAAAADNAIEALAGDPSPAVRIALARAIREEPSTRFEEVLARLASAKEPAVVMEVARAMGRMKAERFLPELVLLLARRHEGAAAREALVDFGEPAFVHLARCLADEATPPAVRASLPRAISKFEPSRAAPVLLRHLADDADGAVRFRVLRALCRLRDEDPDVALDATTLAKAADHALRAALRNLDWRLSLEKAKTDDPKRATHAFTLLGLMLRDKEGDAIARLFRILGLLVPTENFVRIHRGLQSKSAKSRSSSRELIENTVRPPLRQPVLALVDDVADAERLARAAPYYVAKPAGYREVLRAVRARGGELASLVDYHAAEAGLELAGEAPAREESSSAFAAAIEGARKKLRPHEGGERAT